MGICRRRKIKGSSFQLLGLAGLIAVVLSCNDGQQKKYAKESSLPNSVIGNSYEYLKSEFQDSTKQILNQKWGPYFSKEFDSSTQIYVDTILINPDSTRVAFFAIATYSEIANTPIAVGGHARFDANCFIGQKDETGLWRIAWFDAENFSRYNDASKISQRIRAAFFHNLKKREGVDGSSLYKFNLNEPGFWTGPVWDMYFR